jgi:hypothetical protein
MLAGWQMACRRSQEAPVVQGPECQPWGRFQQCLRNQQDSISDVVGVAFFNVLEVPCFVLKEQEACVAWYWWGGYVDVPLGPFLASSFLGVNLSPTLVREGCLSVCPQGMRSSFL